MKPPSHLSLFALLLGVAACGSEAAVAADSGVDVSPVPTDNPRLDTPVTPDIPATPDIPVLDVPMTPDAPRADVPSEACVRPDIVRLATRIDCSPRADGGVCPTGYACLSFAGFVLGQFCGRSCAADCDCPAGERCGSYEDKAGTHSLCFDPNGG